ncbi:MAG TPA: GAF domain-containing protein [Aggregatilineales bacterium]|nr:GAF domain-containing protein [Aggregatilineales bacterium]
MVNQPTQPGEAPVGLVESLEHATVEIEQLDRRLTRLTELLKVRGILFADEFTIVVNKIRDNVRIALKGSQQATRKLEQLQKLVDTSTLLTSSLSVDRVLEQVLDTVISLTGAERVFLMLRDSKTGELAIRAARNWDKENVDKNDASISRGIINTTLQNGKPVITTNAQADNRFQQMVSVVNNTLRSIVCVPFSLHGQTIGALYADNRMQAGIFGDEIVPTLTAFANQAAIAIENARLFEQVKADLDQAQIQLQTLRIKIDLQQANSQINEIVDSDLFKRLARKEDTPPKEAGAGSAG